MKVRWREHEMIFITMLVVIQIISALLQMYDPSFGQPGIDFASGFRENGFSFDYGRNVLIPQMGSTLLMYLGYLSINKFLLPIIRNISPNDPQKLLTLRISKVVVEIILISGILSIGVNALSFYAKPHLFNYGEYRFFAFFGYNDTPLTKLFFGWGKAIGLVIFITGIVGLRELMIWFIERPGARREFGILILNTITPLLFVYFLLLYFINPVHARFLDYLAWGIPAIALYIYFTFWLFPFRENHRWLQGPVLLRLLTSTFVGALLSAMVFSGSHKLLEFFFYWLFLLLIVTPLSWLLFQQRRDKILQLKGMEAALAKSNTDLQFLRSQINPHFLFNALNTLYGTALREKAEQTAEGIQMLGDMMRFMLHENTLDFIPMNKEIAYLRNYISLQKLRTPQSPDILITDNIGDTKCNQRIAPMLLIPFVENAFKHGISLQEKSWIDIKLACGESCISFEVRNSLHAGYGIEMENEKSGIGLKNVAQRLNLLYPGKHELIILKEQHEFIAKLVIK